MEPDTVARSQWKIAETGQIHFTLRRYVSRRKSETEKRGVVRSKYRVFVKTLGYKRRKWDGSQGSSEEFSCIGITKEKQPMGSKGLHKV